jgi:hypothetical protein
MKPINNSNKLKNVFPEDSLKEKQQPLRTAKKDSVEISNTSKVFAKLDNYFNLGKTDRLDVGKLNGAEKKEFLKMLSSMLKKGVVGYEVLEVNGKPEKHDITLQIGDQRLKGAKLYKKKNYKD